MTRPGCHLCGSATGPWLPDPSADRWPSGAQKLICSRRCQDEPPADTGNADAKDTRKGESTLSPGVLDLLAAIVEAADVPLPSIAPADERAWQVLMARRLADLHTTLSIAISPEWAPTLDPAREAAAIRERTANAPVTYTVWETPADGGGR